MWASALQTTGENYGETIAVTSDGSGSIYAAGRFRGTLDFDPGAGTAVRSSVSLAYDIFITKTSAEGNLQWVKTFGGAGDDIVTDIALDSQGNICLSGTFEGQVDMDPGAGIQLQQSQDYRDGFLLRLNSAADFSGFAQFNGQVEQIAMAPGGEILAGGRFSNGDDLNPGIGVYASYGNGGFVVKMSEQLDFQWAWTKNAPEFERAEVRAVAVSANGDILVGVGFLESAYEIPTGMFVSRLTSTGEEYWATGSEEGRINGGCFDNEGNTYIAGGASGTFTFNGVNISNSSRTLAFVIKIDERGVRSGFVSLVRSVPLQNPWRSPATITLSCPAGLMGQRISIRALEQRSFRGQRNDQKDLSALWQVMEIFAGQEPSRALAASLFKICT